MDETIGVPSQEIDLSRVLADMAGAIVDHPENISVTETENDDELVLTMTVDESDMGMIIGKHGKIARSLRIVMKAAAKAADKKVSVDIK